MAVTQSGNKVTLFGAEADALTGRIHIAKFLWVKPATAADDIVISDSKGKVLWKSTCDIANTDQCISFDRGFWADGVTLTTLDSGSFILYKR